MIPKPGVVDEFEAIHVNRVVVKKKLFNVKHEVYGTEISYFCSPDIKARILLYIRISLVKKGRDRNG